MKEDLDAKYTSRAAIVGYALARALFERLDGGNMQGEVASAALKHLPAKPDGGENPAGLQNWLDAEAELNRLGAAGR